MVWLVRHAQSAPDSSTSSSRWGLSDLGRMQARALRIDGPTRLLAGPEPRMADTLVHLGPVEVDDRYAESHSAGWLGEDDFVATVARFFAEPDREPAAGWEPASAVVDRFELIDASARPLAEGDSRCGSSRRGGSAKGGASFPLRTEGRWVASPQ